MKAAYLKALLGGSTFAVIATMALLVSLGQTTTASSLSPRQEMAAIPVAQEPALEINEQELISMAKDAVITRLIGAGEIRFRGLSAKLVSGSKRVVCGSVTYRQPVYLPARTEKFVTVFPERTTTLESGHSDFGSLMVAHCFKG